MAINIMTGGVSNILGTSCGNNILFANVANVIIGNESQNNSIGNGVNNCQISGNSNRINNGCTLLMLNSASFNDFAPHCNHLSLYDAAQNSFAPGCGNIRIGTQCNRNRFGAECGNIELITTNYACIDNIFEAACANITLTASSYNTFGQRCGDDGAIVLNSQCYRNEFGAGCYKIALPALSQDNTFGVECYDIMLNPGNSAICNKFGNLCSNINITTSLSNIEANIFEELCGFITINVMIMQGVTFAAKALSINITNPNSQLNKVNFETDINGLTISASLSNFWSNVWYNGSVVNTSKNGYRYVYSTGSNFTFVTIP